MALVALLSNPSSTGNRSRLADVRRFCAEHPEIFHYEVEEIGQIAEALKSIARVKPAVLVLNGGDGTVQATLTELHHGGHFDGTPPPVAVLPNGKTNLIALDLGARGDPLEALDRIVAMARGDLAEHIVVREMIALSDGEEGSRPVLGMFLGGAGLAETILYCRTKIYPLGLPNTVSHALTATASIFSMLFGVKARFLPEAGPTVKVSLIRQGEYQGSFALVIVTTLERLLLGTRTDRQLGGGRLKFMAVERNVPAIGRMLWDAVVGRLGTRRSRGIHLEQGDMIRIDSDHGKVLFDGELFESSPGHPIILQPSQPMPFLKLAA